MRAPWGRIFFWISACAIQVTDVQASLYVYVDTKMMNDTVSLRVKEGGSRIDRQGRANVT
jgi:hypothetical protein